MADLCKEVKRLKQMFLSFKISHVLRVKQNIFNFEITYFIFCNFLSICACCFVQYFYSTLRQIVPFLFFFWFNWGLWSTKTDLVDYHAIFDLSLWSTCNILWVNHVGKKSHSPDQSLKLTHNSKLELDSLASCSKLNIYQIKLILELDSFLPSRSIKYTAYRPKQILRQTLCMERDTDTTNS